MNLMMLEGRMRNAVKKIKAEYQIAEDEVPEGFDELFTSQKVGLNKEFNIPEKLDSVEDVLTEIKKLDTELREVEL